MTTKPSSTNSKKGPRSIAKDLRSAASALEHGRHATAVKKLATIAPSFSPRQTDTIIAALRAYQEPGRCDVLAAASEIASEHGDPLSNFEIDALVLQINCCPTPLNQEDKELAILDEALNSAESILTPLLKKYDSETLTLMFKQHVKTHLGTELSNITDHGNRSDFEEEEYGCTLTLFEQLVGLASLVSAGNTEIDHLEARANEVLDKLNALELGGN